MVSAELFADKQERKHPGLIRWLSVALPLYFRNAVDVPCTSLIQRPAVSYGYILSLKMHPHGAGFQALVFLLAPQT